MRVALRADASVVMGVGHIKRCLSLASALRAVGADVLLVARDLGVDVDHLARVADVAMVVLPAPRGGGFVGADSMPHAAWAGVDWKLDAEQTALALRDWRPDWVVVDEYAFDARWHELVRRQLAARIAVVDDLADRDLLADVVVDHNFHLDHRAKYRERIASATPILGGPRFALLGAAYMAARPCAVRESVHSVGIFMGGTDAANLSGLVLRACREVARFDGAIEIVTTRAYEHDAALREQAAASPGTVVSCDLPDLADFFARHDLQIGAGGGATWERCRAGAPSLVLITNINQQSVLPGLTATGAAEVLEAPAALDVQVVGSTIRVLLDDVQRRRSLSERSRMLVDGLGARRVALRLTADAMAVRRANAGDSALMHAWRNHPTTRGASTDSREIPWLMHQQWLARTLADGSRCLLVAHVGRIDVGVIRFDVVGSVAEVSLYLDPNLHGLGLGGAMLRAGEGYLLARHCGVGVFVATVLESNGASLRMFEAAGYRNEQGVWRKRVAAPALNS